MKTDGYLTLFSFFLTPTEWVSREGHIKGKHVGLTLCVPEAVYCCWCHFLLKMCLEVEERFVVPKSTECYRDVNLILCKRDLVNQKRSLWELPHGGGGLAQWLERWTGYPRVEGSNQEKLRVFLESKRLCSLAVGVPNPRVHTYVRMRKTMYAR